VDTWVTEYNCDRPHQSLNMDYPTDRFAPSQQSRAAAQELLPLRLPASLGLTPTPASSSPPIPAAPPVSASASSQPVREDAETPVAPVVYQGGPVEFDRVVPASGNLAVRGKQFWLGVGGCPARR
jgi:hypothetical protein